MNGQQAVHLRFAPPIHRLGLSMLPSTRLASALLIAIFAIPMHAQNGVLSISVKDYATQQPVAGKVTIQGPKSLATQTDEKGRLTLSLPSGKYEVTISAPRYLLGGWGGTLWGNPRADTPHEVQLLRAFGGAPVPHGQTGTLNITVRDDRNYYAVRAKVEIEGPKSLSMETDDNGSLKLSLPTGDDYLLQISAPSYKPMVWQPLAIRPGENASGAMLDPIKAAGKPPVWKSLDAQLRPGYATVEGLAVDEQGHPVADVRVTLQGKGIQTVETTSDDKGYFGFLLPTPPETPSPQDPDGLPGTGEVTMAKPGYRTQIHDDVVIFENMTNGVGLDEMKLGSGLDKFDEAPAWLNGTGGTCIGEHACEEDYIPPHLHLRTNTQKATPSDSPRPQ